MKILSLKTSRAGLARLAAFISSAFFILGSAHAQSGTALLQHAPNLNGAVVVNGSLQQMTGESVTINGSASISGDLLVPGTPAVTLTGHPVFGGVIVGAGSASPSNYSVILNGTPSLGHLRTRTNPTALPTVSAPPKPTGTRNVTITAAGQSIGSFSTLNNLTLNGNVGQVAIPPGTYGTFTANGAAGFTLGVTGATQPAVYNFQSLVLNGTGQLQILGPVVITVAANVTINGGSGSLVHPEWFVLNVASGALNINGNISVYAFVTAPSSAVTLNGSSQLIGRLVASQLLLNGNSVLRLQGATAPQPPVANNQSVTTAENAAVVVILAATQANNDPLIYTAGTANHGTLSGTAPNLTYTPAANFFGADSFTFTAKDGAVVSNAATVSISVTKVNYPPVAANQSVTTAENAAIAINLTATQTNNDALTYTNGAASHGVLSGTAPNLTYTPATNYFGGDSFTFTAKDGTVVSNTATVSISVTKVNYPPVAANQSVTTAENTAIAINLTASQANNDPLTYTNGTASHGTLSGIAPALTYTPPANYFGADNFTFTAKDGTVVSNTGAVSITVTKVNYPPVAANQAVTTAENVAIPINLTAIQANNDALTYTNGTASHGALTGTVPHLTYTPAPNYFGGDSFTFTANDGAVVSNVATVTITVTPIAKTALLEIMMPTNGQVVDHVRPMFAAHYAGTTPVKPDSFHIYVDGRDFSSEAMLEDGEVMFDPQFNLEQGAHALRVDWLSGGQLIATDSIVFSISSAIVGTRFEAEVRSTTGEPLNRVRVRADVQEVFTDTNGRFAFDNLPDQQVVFHFDTSTVVDGKSYTPVNLAFTVTNGQRTRIERPIYVAQYDPSSGVLVQSNAPFDQTVTHPSLPGVRLIIPANTEIAFPDGSSQARVTLVNIPVDRSPNCLGPGFRPARLIAIQPENTILSKPAQLITPNDYRLPDGFPVGLKSLNIESGKFSQVGYGKVTNNELVGLPGSGLTTFDWHCWHFINGQWVFVDGDKRNQQEHDKTVCSTMKMQSGALEEDHATPPYTSLGQPRSVTLHYSSLSAAPSIEMSGTIQMMSAYLPYPVGADGNIVVGAPPVGNLSSSISGSFGSAQTYYDPSGLIPNWGGAGMVGNGNVNTGAATTGLYSAVARTSAYILAEDRVTWLVNSSEQTFKAGIINGREIQPALGVGWSLVNIDRLLFNRGADVLLATGAGKLQRFTARTTVSRLAEANFSAELDSLEGASTDGDVSTTAGMGVSRAQEGYKAFLLRAAVESEVDTILRIPFNNLGYGRIAMDIDIFGDIPVNLFDVARVYYNWSSTRTTDYTDSNFSFNNSVAAPLDGMLVLAGADTGYFRRSGWRTIYLPLPAASLGKKGFLEIRLHRVQQGGSGGYGGPVIPPTLAKTALMVDNFRLEGKVTSYVVNTFVGEPGDSSELAYRPDTSEYTRSFVDGTQEVFDSLGRQVRTADRQGNTTTYIYIDANGDGQPFELSSITDPVGLVTNFNYVGGRLGQINDPAGRTTQFTYDTAGNLTRITNPDGTTRSFTYESSNRMTSQADGLGQVRQYFYGPSGRLSGVTRADGAQYSYAPTQAVGAAPAGFGSFDAPAAPVAARNTTMADGNGNTETTALNSSGQPVVFNDAEGGKASISYTSDRLPQTIILPNGSSTSTVYNTDGKPTSVTKTGAGTYRFAYSQFSLVASITDPLNRVTTFTYDTSGNLTKITDAAGGISSMTYDSRGLALSISDQRNNVTRFTYDGYGRTVAISDALGHVTSFGYNTAGNLITTTDPLGRITSYVYDLGNKVTQVTAADGGVTLYTYDNDKNLVKRTDPLGHSSTWTYDARQRPLSVTNALNQITQMSYDPVGNLTALIDAAANNWTFTYDGLDRKNSATDPKGHVTRWSYDPLGLVTKITFPDGTNSQNIYDIANRLVKTIAPDGAATQYTFDVADQVTSVTDPIGGVVQSTYDSLGRKTSILDQLNRVTQTAYDSVGNVLNVTRPDATITSYEYDAANRLTKQTAADGGVVSYDYDSAGNPTSLIDANGHPRNFSYDAMNRRQSETDASGRSRQFNYDLAGNLTSLRRRNAVTLFYTYDALNRIVSKQLPTVNGIPADTVNYAYDNLGNIITVSDNDSTITQTYDSLSLLLQTTQTYNGSSIGLAYAYDLLNRRSQLTDATGTINYIYNTNSRLTQLKDSAGRSYSFSYDALSRLTGRAYPNGVLTTSTYDAASQLLSIVHSNGAVVLSETDYTYNLLGNRTGEAREDGNTRAFTYDPVDRLLSAASSISAVINERFDYDKEGNWAFNGRIYDADNQLLSDGSYDYIYDTEGNLTSRSNRLIASDTTAYVYDAENRLVQVIVGPVGSPTSKTSYSYDALGRRIGKMVNGVLVRYVLDGDNARLELNGSNSLIAINNYAGLDNLLARDAGSSTAFVMQDGLGSTIGITDSTGAVVERYRYTAYGVLSVLSSDYSPRASAPRVPYTFTGRDLDSEAGLYFNRSRYYSPILGRWLSRDKIGEAGGRNLYSYVRNQPNSLIDPYGLNGIDVHQFGTAYLAESAGFPADEAMRLGEQTQMLDAPGDPRDAMRGGVNYSNMEKYHFVDQDRLSELHDIAMRHPEDGRAGGEYFHALEDAFPHDRGVGDRSGVYYGDVPALGIHHGGAIGHGAEFHGPDWTWTDVEKGMKEGECVYKRLQEYAKARGIDTSKAKSWDQIKDQYERFLSYRPDLMPSPIVPEATFEGYDEKIKILNPNYSMPPEYRDDKYPSRWNLPIPPAPYNAHYPSPNTPFSGIGR